jgi:hypothetical protein
MVEVVDSLAELSKICSHTNRIRSRKLLLETGKLDPLVSSIPATSRGADGIDEETLPLAKWSINDGEGRTTMNPRGCGDGYKI